MALRFLILSSKSLKNDRFYLIDIVYRHVSWSSVPTLRFWRSQPVLCGVDYKVGHKTDAYSDHLNSILHRYIREIDPEDFYLVFVIEVIEEVLFENIHELRAREQRYIDLLQPPLNEYRAVRHEQEREIQREKHKKWSSSRVVCENCGKETARGDY